MITIKEIADKAGVSPTTVSNVINGHTEKMAKDTLDRITNLIKEKNYISNMGGRLLANNGSKIISVIVCFSIREDTNVMKDSFFGEIIGELEYEISRQGYYMMLYIARNVDECVKASLAWNSEGIIMIGCPPVDCRRLYEQITKPLTFIDSYFTDQDHPYVNVGLEDYKGAYAITEYLIQHGHREIAFMVNGDHPNGVDLERLNGYKAALEDNGITYQKKFFLPFSYQYDVFSNEMEELAKHSLHEYSALFFTADQFAAYCVSIFTDLGIKIPQDISIVGFDNNSYSQRCRPKITTVNQDVDKKAYYAVLQTIKQIKEIELSEYNIQLPSKVIVRDSVANQNADGRRKQ